MKSSARLSQRLNAIADDVEAVSNALRPRFEVHVAVTARERIEAARLVAQAYVQEGYLSQYDGGELRPFLSPHHLLNETTIFMVKNGARIVATLAVIRDSRAGLPMEELYGAEIAKLRKDGRRLCEICSLAVELESGRQNSGLVLELFKAANTYARCVANADDVCLTIKPSHAPFYSRIAFEEFGGFKLDERFAFAETLAMRLRRETVEAIADSGRGLDRKSRLMARVFSVHSSDEQKRIRAELDASVSSSREVLNSISWLPEILARATPKQIEYLWQTQNRRISTSNLEGSIRQHDRNSVLVSC